MCIFIVKNVCENGYGEELQDYLCFYGLQWYFLMV